MCPIIVDDEALFASLPPPTGSGIRRRPIPPTIVEVKDVEEDRGRSRSRSPSRPTPIFIPPNQRDFCYGASSPSRSRSRSHSRGRSRSSSRSWRRRSYSPAPPIITIPPPSSPPIPIVPPGPSQFVPPTSWVPPPSWVTPPSWYGRPPSTVWPIQAPKQPIDILTFKYNKSMAYAPATKTYDEAIDNVLELWPELRDVERDQIRLLVTGSDNLVRVPRMTWSAILCDVPRYEVVHVQVEQLPPPPEYQGKGKGKWAGNNDKGHRSGGMFSSIRRIFSG